MADHALAKTELVFEFRIDFLRVQIPDREIAASLIQIADRSGTGEKLRNNQFPLFSNHKVPPPR